MGLQSSPAKYWGLRAYSLLLRHLIETTARPFRPQPRHRSRSLSSSTLVPPLPPSRTRRASGVSSATWSQAVQLTFTRSPRPRSPMRAREGEHRVRLRVPSLFYEIS
jgi:hypothetical protein